MNINFNIYNSYTDCAEAVQFNNIKDLNDGFRELVNWCFGSEYGIEAYCNKVGTLDVEGIDYENFDEYDFINHDDYNFVMDGFKMALSIIDYELN